MAKMTSFFMLSTNHLLLEIIYLVLWSLLCMQCEDSFMSDDSLNYGTVFRVKISRTHWNFGRHCPDFQTWSGWLHVSFLACKGSTGLRFLHIDTRYLLTILFNHCVTCYSEASGRNGDKVVLYEDVAKKQLQEFILTLRGCETMVDACSSLRVILKHDKSRRLLHLLTPGIITTLHIHIFRLVNPQHLTYFFFLCQDKVFQTSHPPLSISRMLLTG